MNKKILVSYLSTKFDTKKSFDDFVKNYKKYKSGYKHRLLICYKLLEKKKIDIYRKKLKSLNHLEFIDFEKRNDYDFGSYYRIAKKYNNYNILFLNGHSYPVKNNWLKKTVKHFKDNTIIGFTGSYQSLFSSLKIKKVYKIYQNLRNYVFYKKNFNKFPNPHIRTSCFLINSIDFINFNKSRKYEKKEDTWKTESGKKGLTNYFLKKGYRVIVVNSEGKAFKHNKWKQSKTFCNGSQEKLLISDKHSRKYEYSNSKQRKIFNKLVWGN